MRFSRGSVKIVQSLDSAKILTENTPKGGKVYGNYRDSFFIVFLIKQGA